MHAYDFWQLKFILSFSSIFNFVYAKRTDDVGVGDESCDLFKGGWIWDGGGEKVPLYTNWSCKTLPDPKNCLLHGRADKDYLQWRWKPEQCELPIFDPSTFLNIVQGKALAFVGDSVARNQMESLLCLLSTVCFSAFFSPSYIINYICIYIFNAQLIKQVAFSGFDDHFHGRPKKLI